VDLALVRVNGAPIRGESAAPFQFSTAYEETIGGFLCLAVDPEEARREEALVGKPTISPAPPAVSHNGSSNGHGPVAPPHSKIAPDAILYEPQLPAPPPKPSRAPVVINWAALGMVDPDLAAEGEAAPAPAPVVEPAPAPRVEVAAMPAIAPAPTPRVESPALAPAPALPRKVEVVATPAIAPQAKDQPVESRSGEVSPVEAKPLVAEAAVKPAAAAVAASAIEPPQAAATPEERVPAFCSKPAAMELRLANDAFAPIVEADFESRVFEIETPATPTCPLRPKVVFGPSPPPPAAPEAQVAPAPPVVDGKERPAGAADESPKPQEFLKAAKAPAAPAAVTAARKPPEAAGLTSELPASVPAAASVPQRPWSRRRAMEAMNRKPVEAPETGTAAPDSGPAAPEQPKAATGTEAPPPIPERAQRRVGESSGLEALRTEMEKNPETNYGSTSKSRRVAVIVALIFAILLVGYLIKQALGAMTERPADASQVEAYGVSLIAGENGWSLDWGGPNGGAIAGREVEIFRPSMTMSDYRLEFEGQIDRKALGWVFRAVNPRNYYATKLELVRAGNASRAMLSRIAVINGEETQKAETELPAIVKPETVFKVRTDVFGPVFRTYVQEKLADTWIDDRLKTGGVGLLKDKDEVADVRLIQLHALRVAK
jgi:hypothetical protein